MEPCRAAGVGASCALRLGPLDRPAIERGVRVPKNCRAELMSHESAEPGRGVVYNLPTPFSDSLRNRQFTRFFAEYRGAAFAVRTEDGWSWRSTPSRPPECVAAFRSREELDAVVGDAKEATLGRIFLEGGLEIQGNIFALLSVTEYALRHSEGLSTGLVQTIGRISADISRRLLHVRGGSNCQSWRCAPCPMDLPLTFYEPWLGSTLAHTSAVFRSADENFDSAQRHALDRACAELGLEPGDRLLDVGCGWGSLLLHAARDYGVDVRGIASSPAQVEAAWERVCREGLKPKSWIECRDLRTAPLGDESFDKIADLGIFEQTAFSDLGKYLVCVQKMLLPGGLFLIDRMTRSRDSRPVIRSMHPGLLSEPLSKELAIAESAGLELMSVQSLQKQYEQTLRTWIEHLRQNWMGEANDPLEHGYRAWLLYLVEIVTSLDTEELQVHRILLRRPRRPRSALC